MSVLATEPPGTPKTATVRFYVHDATTGQPLQGTAYIQTGAGTITKPVHPNGYTDDEIFSTMGAYQYSVNAYGYTTYNSQFQVAYGENKVIDVPMGALPHKR